MIFDITIDAVNFLLTLMAILVLLMVVFRTRNKLDTAFKFYLAVPITLAIASILKLNSYNGFIDVDVANQIVIASRLVALVFFILGSLVMLFIIDKESR